MNERVFRGPMPIESRKQESLELPLELTPRTKKDLRPRLPRAKELRAFREFEQPTRVLTTHAEIASGPPVQVETPVA